MEEKEIIKREIRGGEVVISREQEDKDKSRVIRGTVMVLGEFSEIYRDEDIVVREMIAPEAVPESLLKESDIKMTLFHNSQKLLARSKKGKGTLKYSRDDKGVYFEFEAPNTPDGDTALELVERGIIDGCSFWAWSKHEDMKEERKREGDLIIVERTILRFREFEDFTLTPSPAYEQTEVERVKRDISELKNMIRDDQKQDYSSQWEEIERESERTI